jgi:hypothetical protein
MKIKFVATFPAKHYDLYGRNFLFQFDKVLKNLRLSSDADIILSVSIDGLNDIKDPKLKQLNYIELIDYKIDTYSRDEFLQGVNVEDQTLLGIAGDVAKQIIRWSFKGMMQLYHLKEAPGNYDYIVYIDADTIFKKNIKFDELLKLLPSEMELISAVFRADIGKYTETGWIAWNVNHVNFKGWVEKYSTGWHDHIYEDLSAYHDCAIFDWACSDFNEKIFKNLSGGGDHGFNSGQLGNFLDHKKGIRKHLGFSYENIPLLNNKIGYIIYKLMFSLYTKLKKTF